jgi:hypothetical protein
MVASSKRQGASRGTTPPLVRLSVRSGLLWQERIHPLSLSLVSVLSPMCFCFLCRAVGPNKQCHHLQVLFQYISSQFAVPASSPPLPALVYTGFLMTPSSSLLQGRATPVNVNLTWDCSLFLPVVPFIYSVNSVNGGA